MTTPPHNKISSKRGLVLLGFLALSTFALLGLLVVLIHSWSSSIVIRDLLKVGPGMIVIAALVAFFSTISVTITKRGISSKFLFFFFPVRQVSSWSDIIAIKVPPYNGAGFFGYNFILERKDSKPGGFVVAELFSNRHEIIMASIEAASLANPKVKVDTLLIEKYGSPPYGILRNK